MINKNFFQIKKINKVVFLGFSPNLESFINLNKKNNIESFIFTSPNQFKQLSKFKKINEFKVIKSLDDNFRKYVKKNFNIENTLFISLSSRWIFKKKTINFLKKNLINIHSSRLPHDRGGATISWQIMRGDRLHCQSIHLVDDGVDTGPIIFQKLSIYPKSCQIPKDYEKFDLEKLNYLYEDFLKNLIKKKKLKISYQNENLSYYNPRLNTDKDAWIDWSMNYIEIYRFINAFDEPYSGAKTLVNKKIVSLKSVHLHSGEMFGHKFMTGIIFRKDKNWLIVKISDNHNLIIEKVLDNKGKNIISELKVGDRFFSNMKMIEKSKLVRTRYNQGGLK